MKTRGTDLTAIWGKPDTSILTPKQVSLRLPVVVAAKIDALLDMYPHKNRTEIVGDLLLAAISDVEDALKPQRTGVGERHYDSDLDVEYYDDYIGPGPDFERLWQEHLEKYEEQLGHEVPAPDRTRKGSSNG